MIILTIIYIGTLFFSCGGGGGENNTPESKEITKEVSGLKQNTTYYWKVVAEDSNGDTAESKIFSFKTK